VSAQESLDRTIADINELPHDFDEGTKEALLDHLENASIFMTFELWQEVPVHLNMAKTVLANFVRGIRMARKILSSKDDADVGILEHLPFDVRQEIWMRTRPVVSVNA
jgi:hypothetical protein